MKERTAAPGYLITVSASSCTVSSGKRVTLEVKDDPDMKGKVSVEKVADGTGIFLREQNLLCLPGIKIQEAMKTGNF